MRNGKDTNALEDPEKKKETKVASLVICLVGSRHAPGVCLSCSAASAWQVAWAPKKQHKLGSHMHEFDNTPLDTKKVVEDLKNLKNKLIASPLKLLGEAKEVLTRNDKCSRFCPRLIATCTRRVTHRHPFLRHSSLCTKPIRASL